MKPYLSYLSARFRAMLQYRAAAFAGMVTQVFWGFIRIMILEAFYSSSQAAQPMSFSQVVAYVWLGQAFLGLFPWNVDREIQSMIKTGGVSYELLRPLDLYWIWYFRAIAWRSAATLLRCIPLLIFAGILLPLIGAGDIALRLPPDLSSAFFWLISMAFVLLLSAAITTFGHITMMWTISGEGIGVLIPISAMIFSGMIVPLPLFPDWLQTFFRMLPFHALADTPFRIYSGNIADTEAVWLLFQQAAWVVAIIFAGKILIARGMKRLVIQGG